jgi:antitoxin component YwqK of YwqJK toxin-antitoxin module
MKLLCIQIIRKMVKENYIQQLDNYGQMGKWTNGQMDDICSYINGKKNGEQKEYYSNGQLLDIVMYFNDKKKWQNRNKK